MMIRSACTVRGFKRLKCQQFFVFIILTFSIADLESKTTSKSQRKWGINVGRLSAFPLTESRCIDDDKSPCVIFIFIKNKFRLQFLALICF